MRGGDGGQEERFCFVLVELFTCQAYQTQQKMQNSLFVHHLVFTTKTKASSFLLEAYSMLYMPHQSYKPLMHEVF